MKTAASDAARKALDVFWTTPRGGSDCIVVRVDRAAMRIAHVRDAAEATTLHREWAECNFEYEAGRIEVFNRFKGQQACDT